MKVGIGPIPLEELPETSLDRVYAHALDDAERAEAAGLDAVWVDGNHFTDEAHGPSPLLVAAALASRTKRVTVGIATLTLSIGEHPLHVAEEALFLEALTGGRLVLGVGLGYRKEELAGFEVELGDRRGRFDEALEILQVAFSDQPSFAPGGRHYRIGAPVVPHPRPIRRGGPPIWVGGGWQPAAVRRVARLGLPLISQFFESPETIAEKVRLYRDAAAPDAAGCATVPAIRDVAIGSEPDLAARLLPVYRRYAAWGMPLLGRATAPEEIGPAEVARLAVLGSAEHVAERLAELGAAGATDVLARADLPGIPREVCEETIAALGAIRSSLQS